MRAVRVNVNVSVMISVLTATMFFAAPAGISFAQVKNAADVETAAGKRSGDSAFIDSRDGKKYRTVMIGGKRWMGENLNYQATSGSRCYENDSSYCDKYGRLYDWKTAVNVCPAGWHLPSSREWDDLVNTAGGEIVAGKKLKSTFGWAKKGNGTDEYVFSALPGGAGNSHGYFFNAGVNGYWWTVTEVRSGYAAYRRNMYYANDSIDEIISNETGVFSVRCVENGSRVR